MADLAQFLTGLQRGAQVGIPLGQRAAALGQQVQQQRRQQFNQGLETLANIHRVPKPFRTRVLAEINDNAFGGALDEDTINRYARLSDQDSQMMGELMQQALPGFTPEQFAAVTRRMGGITPAFQFLGQFADRRAAQQAQQQERDDLAALGQVGQPTMQAQAPPAPASPRGVIAATEPQRTETLTLPTPAQPDNASRIQALTQQLMFFTSDPRGQRLLQTETGQNRFRAIQAELSARTQQEQRGTATARAGREEQRAITKEQREAARNLRKEFTQVSKTFRDVAAAYGRVQASIQDPSPAGDIALVFAYMKMLDPTSVVREGEQATARNAGGVPDRIRNTYNRLLTGELFGGERSRIRQDFANRAELLFAKAKEDQDLMRQQFSDIAARQNLNPADVLLQFRQRQTGEQRRRPQPAAPGVSERPPGLTPETQQRIQDRYNK